MANTEYVNFQNLQEYDAQIKNFIIEVLNEGTKSNIEDLNERVQYLLSSFIASSQYIDVVKDNKKDFSVTYLTAVTSRLLEAIEEQKKGLAESADVANEIINNEAVISKLVRMMRGIIGFSQNAEFTEDWEQHFGDMDMMEAVEQNDESVFGLGTIEVDMFNHIGFEPDGEMNLHGDHSTIINAVNAHTDILSQLDKYIGGADGLVKTTYNELVKLRDASALKPGTLYRITDYDCTTSQTNTLSAHNHFDIIVLALTESTLSEDAKAIQNEDTTYFDNCNLSVWQLKYSIDNDVFRFAWACADFIACNSGSWYKVPQGYGHDNIVVDGVKYYAWQQSYASSKIYSKSTDYYVGMPLYQYDSSSKTMSQYYASCTGFYSNNGKGVIYYMKDEYDNEAPYDFKNICFRTIGGTTFGNNIYTFYINNYNCDATVYQSETPDRTKIAYSNVIKEYITGGKFKLNHISIFFSTHCASYNNIFQQGCYDILLYDNCYNNSFGQGCYSNTLNPNCGNNSFGQGCFSNTLQVYCFNNSFGQECYSNTLNSNCIGNSFGAHCNANSLSSSCYGNSFGNKCNYIRFRSSGGAYYNYVSYNIFEDGNQYIYFYNTSSSSSNILKNCIIRVGTNNSTLYKTIIPTTCNANYTQEFKNSNSTVTYV